MHRCLSMHPLFSCPMCEPSRLPRAPSIISSYPYPSPVSIAMIVLLTINPFLLLEVVAVHSSSWYPLFLSAWYLVILYYFINDNGGHPCTFHILLWWIYFGLRLCWSLFLGQVARGFVFLPDSSIMELRFIDGNIGCSRRHCVLIFNCGTRSWVWLRPLPLQRFAFVEHVMIFKMVEYWWLF